MATLIFLVSLLVFSALPHDPPLISAHEPTTSSPCHPDHSVLDVPDSDDDTIPRSVGPFDNQLATAVAGTSQNPYSNPESPPDVQINDPPPTSSFASPNSGPTRSHTVPTGSGARTNEISNINSNTNPTGSEATTSGINPGSTEPETSTHGPTNITARRPPTGGDYVNDDQGRFKLVKTFLSLTFQAAIALMIFRLQPTGGNSSPSPSPSPSSSSLIPSTMVGATILFGFTFSMMALMLHQPHPDVANIFSYLGILLGALGFFLMMDMYIPNRYVWSVWTAACLLLVVFVYSLARRARRSP